MTTRTLPQGGFESLWDWRDVAAYLKVSKSWIYHAAASGILPSLHVAGWMLRFDPEAIRRFARQPASGARVVPMKSGIICNDDK